MRTRRTNRRRRVDQIARRAAYDAYLTSGGWRARRRRLVCRLADLAWDPTSVPGLRPGLVPPQWALASPHLHPYRA